MQGFVVDKIRVTNTLRDFGFGSYWEKRSPNNSSALSRAATQGFVVTCQQIQSATHKLRIAKRLQASWIDFGSP